MVDANWDEFRKRRRKYLWFCATFPLFFVYALALKLIDVTIGLDPHGLLSAALILPMFLIMPAWFVTVVVLGIRVMYWRCARCGNYFCFGWFGWSPFVRKCGNCGLPLPPARS